MKSIKSQTHSHINRNGFLSNLIPTAEEIGRINTIKYILPAMDRAVILNYYLFIINSHYQSKDIDEMRKILLDQIAEIARFIKEVLIFNVLNEL